MKVCFILIFLFFIPLLCFPQPDQINFKHLDSKDGLSNNWIRCIYQDEKGFMWFGTSDGLNRFDGYEFKVYRPSTVFGSYISDVNVNAIAQKINNDLWVCTDLGLYIYDYKKDQLVLSSFLESTGLLCVLSENDSIVWFGTKEGLYIYGSAGSQAISFFHNPGDSHSLSDNNINALYYDSQSNIWVGTKKGLNLYRRATGDFERICVPGAEGSMSDFQILSISEDRHGRIWIGTMQNGLFLLQRDKNGKFFFTPVSKGNIYALLVDYQNNIWFSGNAGEGLAVMNLNTYTGKKADRRFFRHIITDAGSISDDNINFIYEDKLNDLWFGTLSGGVNYFSKRTKKFNLVNRESNNNKSISNNHVNAFLEEEKYLWIGTEGGLERYDKGKSIYTNFIFDPDNPRSISGNSVYAIFKDSHRNLWIGTWNGGLNLFNYTDNSFRRFLPDGKPGSISNENIYAITEDDFGYLWVGTLGGGLCRYDYKTGMFTAFRHSEEDSSSLYTNSVNHIRYTSDKRLLVSTYRSLDCFDYGKGNFTHFIYSDDSLGKDLKRHIISIFEDSQNHIWLATNAGIEVMNQNPAKNIRYSTSDGLPGDVIQGILEDLQGNLWISTTRGLSKFINGTQLPEDPIFENFDVYDGLSGNECIKRAAYKNVQGIMYFGTSEGFTFFHPENILTNKAIPEIIFTEFQLLSSDPDVLSKYQSIRKNIDGINELEISYKNSDFTIRYASLNYLNTEKNRYQYMLKGYDRGWIDAEYKRSATYTNIQPGRYTFMVKGSNDDEVWCTYPKTLDIVIHPPWWRTLLFRIAAVVTLALFLLLLYRLRVSSLRNQKKLLENMVVERTLELSEMNVLLEERQEEIIVQNDELEMHRNNLEQIVDERTRELVAARERAEESDKLKSAFLANMSHEIRTPMNAIVGFADLLNENDLNDHEKKLFINTIHSNSQALLVLINDIIDISIIEANQLKLKKVSFNIDAILSELENYYRLKNTKDLDISFTGSHARKDTVYFNDPVRFRQVMTNLLDNAVKYTHRGKIVFGYTAASDHLKFHVSDTGIGISESEICKIFDHFHKVDLESDRLYRGAGIGLSICKKIVEMMGGVIWVESTINVGSVFYFTLPVDKENSA